MKKAKCNTVPFIMPGWFVRVIPTTGNTVFSTMLVLSIDEKGFAHVLQSNGTVKSIKFVEQQHRCAWIYDSDSRPKFCEYDRHQVA